MTTSQRANAVRTERAHAPRSSALFLVAGYVLGQGGVFVIQSALVLQHSDVVWRMSVALSAAVIVTWVADWGAIAYAAGDLHRDSIESVVASNNATRLIIATALLIMALAIASFINNPFFRGFLLSLSVAPLIWSFNVTGLLDREQAGRLHRFLQGCPHLSLAIGAAFTVFDPPFWSGVVTGSAYVMGLSVVLLAQFRVARLLPINPFALDWRNVGPRLIAGWHAQVSFLGGQLFALALAFLAGVLFGQRVGGLLTYVRSAITGVLQIAGFVRRIEIHHACLSDTHDVFSMKLWRSYRGTFSFTLAAIVLMAFIGILGACAAPTEMRQTIALGTAGFLLIVPLASWSNVLYFELLTRGFGRTLAKVDATGLVGSMAFFVLCAGGLGVFAFFVADAVLYLLRLTVFWTVVRERL